MLKCVIPENKKNILLLDLAVFLKSSGVVVHKQLLFLT